MLIVLLAALALSGCASPTPTAAPSATPTPAANVTPKASVTPAPNATALTVSGSVTAPLFLTLADLRGMTQQTVNASYVKDNQTMYVNGTGPSLHAVLDRAGLPSMAKNATFIAPNTTKTVPLSAISVALNSTIIILSDGSLRDIIPGQASDTWVSNLTAITVS